VRVALALALAIVEMSMEQKDGYNAEDLFNYFAQNKVVNQFVQDVYEKSREYEGKVTERQYAALQRIASEHQKIMNHFKTLVRANPNVLKEDSFLGSLFAFFTERGFLSTKQALCLERRVLKE
jgi:hypothetical protein